MPHMAKLRDNQRWQVERGERPYSRIRLKPIREYGPEPENGDELVPATALDKATTAMKAAANAATRKEVTDILAAALHDLGD